MYRWQRLLDDVRVLRIGRARRAQERSAGAVSEHWFEEAVAERELVAELSGDVAVEIRDGRVVGDERRRGQDAVLELAILEKYRARCIEACLAIADEMGVETTICDGTEKRIRSILEARGPIRREAWTPGYIDSLIKKSSVGIRDAAASAMEWVLFEVAASVMVTGDMKRKLIARDGAERLELIGGRVKRRRKARAKPRIEAGIGGVR